MADEGRRGKPKVTFAVLAAGIAAFALLQSLVIPVLTTVQHALHTNPGDRDLGADRLPAVGLDHDADPGADR